MADFPMLRYAPPTPSKPSWLRVLRRWTADWFPIAAMLCLTAAAMLALWVFVAPA